jgi:hypothetical protein
LLALALVAACSGDSPNTTAGGGSGDGEVVPLELSGQVLDFVSGEPVAGTATVSTDGLSPAPTISVTGSSFTIEGVPPFSTFHLLVGSPPDFRSTYNVVVESADQDIDNLDLFALSEDYIDGLYESFGVTKTDGTSLIVAELIDDLGAPVPGIQGTDIQLADGMAGPFFLDADRLPDPNLSASSESGIVVVFNVPPGLVHLSAVDNSELTMNMADSPVAARSATLAEIVVSDGEVVIPQNVSFANDVTPIFENRGCVLCHTGSGIGKDLGGLHLNGEPNKMYKELTEEISPNHGTTRVDLVNPENSLLLTMPSREDPPDVHPNATFTSDQDPDYLTLLGWIQQGAPFN